MFVARTLRYRSLTALLFAIAVPALRADDCVEHNKFISLDIALDVSASMGEFEPWTNSTRLAAATSFATALVNGVAGTGVLSEVGAFGFCSVVTFDTGFVNPNAVKQTLVGIGSTCNGSGTHLYDAIIAGAVGLQNRDPSHLRMLVVITDGEDFTSQSTLEQAAATLAGSGFVVRLVFIGEKTPPTLDKLASLAGGNVQAIAATAGNLNLLVNEIVDATCTNHRPVAAMSLSDADLHLGTEGFTITFSGGPSHDLDTPGNLTYTWTFTRPDSVPESTTGMTVVKTFDDKQLPFGENWGVKLVVKDPKGSTSDPAIQPFKVIGSKPNITLIGPLKPVDALQPIKLSANPAQDIDGGALKFEWTVTGAPPGASLPVGSKWATKDISLPTTEKDITLIGQNPVPAGPWKFECKATDNENQTDVKQIAVHVQNLPPQIKFKGKEHVAVGEQLKVETTVLNDEDGGVLTFDWIVLQAPKSSGIGLNYVFPQLPFIALNTGANEAGTWIFRLKATDNEGESKTADFKVLVDSKPVAKIIGPDKTGNFFNPLELDGSGSTDADSPDTPPDFGHVHAANKVDVSLPPIKKYQWKLKAVPPDLFQKGEFVPGPVSDAFKVNDTGKMLKIPASKLRLGEWLFELDVWDADPGPDHPEGNKATAYHTVQVLDEGLEPLAIAGPPAVYDADISGTVQQNAIFDGSDSIDLDNLLTEKPAPGLGITNYNWTIFGAPPGCNKIPVLPSGASANVAMLFAVGSKITGPCLGGYLAVLEVTDDDKPTPKKGLGPAFLRIGNCVGVLCIDMPTQLQPATIKFSNQTDVIVNYHLNSIVYDDPLFLAGLRLKMSLFHESDLVHPAFDKAFDVDLSPSNKGAKLAVHWSGFDNNDARPQPGKYTLTLQLIDGDGKPAPYVATEKDAIEIQRLDVVVDKTTSHWLDMMGVAAATDKLDVHYSVKGIVPPDPGYDQLVFRIFNKANQELHEGEIAPPYKGSFPWDGKLAGNKYLKADDYELELEILDGGASLGKSPRYPFTVYALVVEPTKVPTDPAGVPIMVNNDDDDANNVADGAQAPAAALEDDLVEIDLSMVPEKIKGKLTLSAVNGEAYRVWSDAKKTTEITLPHDYNVPAEKVPSSVFVEGTGAAAAKLAAKFTPSAGEPTPEHALKLNLIELSLMADANNNYKIDDGDKPLPAVALGLWDRAFRLNADALGAVDSLYNEEDESRIAATNAPENFVGQDSRRFYLRVTDAARNTKPAVIEEAPMSAAEWFTIKNDGTDDDHPFANASMSLIETGPDTGVFVSPAVMLVAGQVDRDQPTNTGMTAHPGKPGYDQANHRTRQVTSPDGSVIFRYLPSAPLASFLKLERPVFPRAPEYRRVLTVHVFNFSDSNKMEPPVPQATIDEVMQELVERLFVLGIGTKVIFNPATDVINLPASSPLDLSDVDDFEGAFGTFTASSEQLELMKLVRAVDPATPANSDTIYILFISAFHGGNRGESFPDGWLPPFSEEKNFVFIAGKTADLRYVAAHEVIAHMLGNQTLTAAEAGGTIPGWEKGGHYGVVQEGFNVCARGELMHVSSPTVVGDARRVWDDVAIHKVQQIIRARSALRFLKMP